ncbi:hypothetical protein C923_02783 [Plasmodium falciparum UGT5.1]|uniref:Uncharacterized protein n=1 Tax=Plasmodium falciparum UGT5.1 TaxID=1237627 RepID=W7JYD1_PLAFA|nr:hypothetical protein C923_02783 [Plasmodium falciparum UGT5.1]
MYDLFKDNFLEQIGYNDAQKNELKVSMKSFFQSSNSQEYTYSRREDNIHSISKSNVTNVKSVKFEEPQDEKNLITIEEIKADNNDSKEKKNEITNINVDEKKDLESVISSEEEKTPTSNNIRKKRKTKRSHKNKDSNTSYDNIELNKILKDDNIEVNKTLKEDNIEVNNTLEEDNIEVNNTLKEDNIEVEKLIDENRDEGETSSNKESNESNEPTKKPSKYTMNLDSPLLKGSSEGETSSNEKQEESNVATKKPSKYTLNLDSPLLKSETKSDVKRGSNKSFSLENIGKLDIGSLLAQNLELLKGFALNFQTLSLFFLVFVGQFYPKHFQKAAIFIGMVNVFLECKRLYGRSQKKLK